MSRNRMMLLIAGVAAVVVVLGGYFLGVQPQLARASVARSDTADTASSNATTRAEIDRLREQAKSLPQMQASLAALRTSVPSVPNTSGLLTELNSTADAAGVTVATVTIGDPQAYSPPAATSPTGSAAAATGGSTPSPSPSATSEPTASPTASTPAVPRATTNSAITSQNFSVIPVAVSVNGSFSQALAFVKGMQSDGRLYLIDSISSATENGSASTGSSDSAAATPSWTFSGYVYVLSDEAGAPQTKG
ncbi:hypothetical protein [Curtobacterium sp. 9128]|uniref:hypothetical protein n=1 Tax=Curtobacterium sp. 9128 TaxID=1793722 RepID=UPI0011A5C41A|nr:hypothetical protein [Curtobacterium sp. 9128]